MIGEIDQAVLGEARVQREVHQTGQSLRADRGHTCHGPRVEDAVANDAQATGTLCDEDGSVG